MNFGVLTGELSEPNAWNYAQYSAGVAHGRSVNIRTTWNALNPNQATTYTLTMPEFSYAPFYYKLPDEGEGLSHKFVFTINSAWYELKGGSVTGNPGYENLNGAYPHINLVDNETFGVYLQRTNTNRLQFGYVCPGDLDWQAEQGTIDLGTAINHTPTNTWTNTPDATGNGCYNTFNMKTGYVLQIGINPARTHIAIRFNGVQIHTVKLPDSIISYFQNPPYDELEQTNLILPSICEGYPQIEDPTAKPHMGVGFAMMTNLIRDNVGYGLFTDDYDFGIFGLHKASKNARNIVAQRALPQRMNRLDGLNSSPGWANAGNQGEPPYVDRSALWQRNNAT